MLVRAKLAEIARRGRRGQIGKLVPAVAGGHMPGELTSFNQRPFFREICHV